jgi:hypothetical protein
MITPHWVSGRVEIGKHNLITVLICAIIAALVACSGNERRAPVATGVGVAPGSVLIDILQGGQPERYWQYEVTPETATVRAVREETFRDQGHEDIPTDYQQPAGAIRCDGAMQVASPDGKLRAFCSDGNNHHLSVADLSGQVVCTWNPGSRRIRGFAWAPNSNSVAILNVSQRWGMGPMELLSAIAEHPVPHDTIFLDFLDVKTGKVTEFLVRANVVSSFTRILKWKEQ